MVPSSPPRVSVIIPTYRRARLLREILSHVLADAATFEVLVVNDGADPETSDLLHRLAFSEPRLRPFAIAHAGRQGARRAGIEEAAGEVVLLLDDDVRAGPGLAEGHARAHSSAEALVVQGYMPVELPARRLPGMAASYLYAEEYERHCRRLESGGLPVLLGLWGGNVSMPTELALTATEGPEFPSSFREDTHLGIVCLRNGATGVFARNLRASHLHRRTLEQYLQDSYRQGAGTYWLHHLHRDLIGPPAPLPDVDPVLRRVLRLPAGERILEPASRLLARSAGRVRLYPVETDALRLARRVHMARGMRTAQVEAEGSAPASPVGS